MKFHGFFVVCSLVENTTRCVLVNAAGCTQDEKESLNKTLQLPVDKIGDRCDEPVQVKFLTTTS